ncbi:MAG TPA: tol-pal system protein YbgF [Blastocatellia bacterium]|nr:tol-pal system protein YbgF [Blastocatellia bacterium]
MSSRFGTLSAFAMLSLLFFATPVASLQSEKEVYQQMKISLDELKNEVVVLERQVRSLQEAQDRNSGQLNALITQIIDNVSAIRQAQSRVAEGSNSALREVGGIGERLAATNQRIDRLSEQLAELKKLIEDMPKLPTFTEITPGNPDQLFAAAYGDFSRGNYDLALSEFRQYVETYPSSEMADNAQYWIGEIYFARRQFNEAIAEFDKLLSQFPKGDKVPAARFKKGLAYAEMQQSDAARAEFRALIRLYPRSLEASLARQQLGDK